MKENTQFLLEKYAMFYTAEALLAERELAFKKHVGSTRLFPSISLRRAFSSKSIITGLSPHSTAG